MRGILEDKKGVYVFDIYSVGRYGERGRGRACTSCVHGQHLRNAFALVEYS